MELRAPPAPRGHERRPRWPFLEIDEAAGAYAGRKWLAHELGRRAAQSVADDWQIISETAAAAPLAATIIDAAPAALLTAAAATLDALVAPREYGNPAASAAADADRPPAPDGDCEPARREQGAAADAAADGHAPTEQGPAPAPAELSGNLLEVSFLAVKPSLSVMVDSS